MQLTIDEQIIKALGKCDHKSCSDCPLYAPWEFTVSCVDRGVEAENRINKYLDNLIHKEYEIKSEFVKDFIKYCRAMFQHCKNTEAKSIMHRKTINICGEEWKFEIIATQTTISTTAAFNGKTDYPLTKWGGDGVRWDSELREFLNREILKV